MRRVWVLLVLAGCFGQKGTLGLPCDDDRQCDLGQRCTAGTCVAVVDTGGPTSVASTSAGMECDGAAIDLSLLPAQLVVVADRSLAANDPWDDDGIGSTALVPRWPTVVAALGDALPMVEADVELGLALAPTSGMCGVDALAVAPAPMNAAAVIAALPSTAGDGAPFSAALGVAYDALRGLEGPAPRAVMLVLAGAPNCVPDGMLEVSDGDVAAIVTQALADGIPTVVVGVDPSEDDNGMVVDGRPDGVSAHAIAGMLAEAGGRPNPSEGYYRATNGALLGFSLRDAIFDARDCVLPREGELADAETISLTVGGAVATQRDACDGDGFVVRDDAIEVCGTPCEAIKLGMPVAATPC
jgi:hypothetical protein